MASGLNITVISGKVVQQPALRESRGNQVVLFFLENKERGANDQIYTTRFRVQFWGDAAPQIHADLHEGDYRIVVGTIEPATVYTDSSGSAQRNNDFKATQVVDPSKEDISLSLLFGNLGSDARLFNEQSDSPFARASLATNLYEGKDGGGNAIQRTLWNSLVLNGRQATSLSQYLSKGAFVGALAKFRPAKPYAASDGSGLRAENQYNVSRIIFGGSSFSGGQRQSGDPAGADDLFAGMGGAPAEAGVGAGSSNSDDLFNGF